MQTATRLGIQECCATLFLVHKYNTKIDSCISAVREEVVVDF